MAKTKQNPKKTSGLKSPAPAKTKKQTCIDMLKRPKGTSLTELQKVTGWQSHSVRGFLSGTAKKMAGTTLVSENDDSGSRRYRIEKASG